MQIALENIVRRNGKADDWDIRQLKKALNRLGYYMPDSQVGINGTPDQRLFAGITQYQKDRGLKVTDTITPDGETLQRLNADLSQTPDGYYIWRTVEDGKVRNSHAAYNRTVRAWSDAPDPGEDFNCRCWAEKAPQEYYDTGLVANKLPEVSSGQAAITPREFYELHKGKTEDMITKGRTDRVVLSHPNDMANPKARFVRLANGKEVDMIHFMVVGRLGYTLGYMNETQQWIRRKESGFNKYDLYSNKLGIEFFQQYGDILEVKPEMVSFYIYQYLENAGQK